MIPEEMNAVLDNMQTIRKGLNGDFNEKVRRLNELTSVLTSPADLPADLSTVRTAKQEKQILLAGPGRRKWQRVVKWCLFAFFFMILGHAILSSVPLGGFDGFFPGPPESIRRPRFGIMTLAGFLAQFVDGSMGLGYGTISTTFLSPMASARHRQQPRAFGPGLLQRRIRLQPPPLRQYQQETVPGDRRSGRDRRHPGPTLAYFGKNIPTMSGYPPFLLYHLSRLLYLRKAFARRKAGDKVRRAGWLASIGGFMDAFAGGGWGTLVTSTLISKRKNPRYVIGRLPGRILRRVGQLHHLFHPAAQHPPHGHRRTDLGGIIAAPIAARLAGKLPARTMFIAVGSLVILTSCSTLWKSVEWVIHHW
jgi:hypothetical protein